MKGATHYIEVWESQYGKIKNHKPLPIELMNGNLKCTKEMGHKTIAIFYIKPKLI